MSTDFGYNLALVTTSAQREAAYAIRRESFKADDGEDGDGVQDAYDDQPNSLTYLLEADDGEPIGTIRFCVYVPHFGWRRIPAFDLYGHELEAQFGAATRIVQSSLFAVTGRHRGMNLLPKLLLLRELLRTAVAYQVERVITVVKNSPAQLKFYSRMAFASIGPPRMHPWAKREGVLLGLRTGDSLRFVRVSKLVWPIGAFDEAAIRPLEVPLEVTPPRSLT
jgi:hypothetical protein